MNAVLPHGYEIEPMHIADVDAVLDLDRSCPEQVRASAPWTHADYLQELRRPQARIDVVRRRADGAVVAYCNHWRLGTEVQIMNIVTHPGIRRQGLARALLAHALTGVPGVTQGTLEVSATNLAALAVYETLGFRVTGRRRAYYSDGTDAVLMTLILTDP